jgi:proline iminopeptidase
MRLLRKAVRVLVGIIIGLAVLFALGYALTFGEHSVPATVAQDPSLPQVTIAGVTYHAETFGDPDNPVVITVHGGPGGDYRSLLNLQQLSDEYFVVFFDQRGAGLSPRVNPEELTLESAIADLDSIVDYYGQGRPVDLVGHSWGAMLVSAYLGRFPEKVEHAVLAEPGFLTTDFARRFLEETQLAFTPGVIYHFLKTKFESLHVIGQDDQAMDDYFGYYFNLYQGDDHPQAGYYCPGDKPDPEGGWRFGAAAAASIQAEAINDEGDIDLNLVEGVENFSNLVLFLTGECQTLIGVDWQREQMKFFSRAELVIIPDAGHEMFKENPTASIVAVRAYLAAPAP